MPTFIESALNLIELKLTPHSRTVLEKRYLRKNEKGEPMETPEEMFYRVAHFIAQADLKYDPNADINKVVTEFYTVMAAFEFLPNSPTLMNAGRELGQLSACFVLPIEDSMESIFSSLKYTALIHKSGGGTGFSFSRLRPKNDVVSSTSGVSSGPVSFMQVFNAATEAIKQGGTRRGANMAILQVDHPDILEFITCKDSNESLNNFNISVGITEEFMECVDRDAEYSLKSPRTGTVISTLPAKEIFNKIVEQAWKNGEPGVVFLDRLNESNPTPEIGRIESTNPCGEQPLLPYESCNLGSINLARMIKDNDVDWERFEYVVRKAVHFLDNVIDLNMYPIEEIRHMSTQNRKVGLGVMGFADMLVRLSIPYDSKQALKFADRIMEFLHRVAREESMELAKKRGSFPNFDKSVYKSGPAMRNATLTTIAPTGTISIIAGASGGIEPLFGLAFTRKNILDGGDFYEINPFFEEALKAANCYSKELIEKIALTGTIRGMKEIPESIRRVFVTAHDITPEDHIRMQAAFQEHTDNAVSKTVNFPHDATIEDVREVYFLAYQLNCKGVTIYRDKSRDKQVLNIGSGKPGVAEEEDLKPRTRPRVTHGVTLRINTGCGRMYVTLNEDEQGLCELFTALGKSGGCSASQSEAVSRLISLALRSGINHEEIISQLRGIRCPKQMLSEGSMIRSCADGIAKAMDTYFEARKNPDLFLGGDKSAAAAGLKIKGDSIGSCPECPECGEMLEFKEGCAVCSVCGYSKCS
jgi:ribonucleoside-diphosphate reductase alpha chain